MVLLEFKPDSSVLGHNRVLNLADADGILETFFEMPVRLKVGNLDLFEFPVCGQERVWINSQTGQGLTSIRRTREPSPWLRLPIIHIATIGVGKIQEVEEKGSVIYRLPGGIDLVLDKHNDIVNIHSNVNERVGQTRFKDLVDAFEAFASAVREFLGREAPELNNHPYWGRWIRDGKI